MRIVEEFLSAREFQRLKRITNSQRGRMDVLGNLQRADFLPPSSTPSPVGLTRSPGMSCSRSSCGLRAEQGSCITI